MNLKKQYKDIDDFFSAPPDVNQKAWGLIHEFYHIVLTYMEDQNITKADLARKLGKSRALISQMFNKTPNLSVKRMVEIAEAVGIEINISTNDLKEFKNVTIVRETVYVPVISNLNWQVMHASSKKSVYKPLDIFTDSSSIEFCCEEVLPG